MLESLIFSLNSTMPLFFIMLLGYLLHRKNFRTDDFVAMANKFVFNVALPVQLFRDLATMDVRASFDGPYVLFCAVVTTVSILVIWVLAKLFLKDKPGAFGRGAPLPAGLCLWPPQGRAAARVRQPYLLCGLLS